MSHIILKLIDSYGIYLVWLILFTEAVLFIGIALPGDSLLVAASVLMYHQHLSFINTLFNILAMILSSVLGSQISFTIGRKFFNFIEKRTKQDGSSYQKLIYKGSKKTNSYLNLYNINYVISIYKFIPIVRTLAPFLMGMNYKIPTKKFLIINIFGTAAWIIFFVAIGHFISRFLNPDKYLGLITFIIIMITLLPIGIEFLKKRKKINRNSV